ncbi:MAG: GH116 family glycosyl-hydrolase, partial [Alphaproteobacteria bacterium]
MWDDLSAIDPQFAYNGERSRYVRFPLGGIGSGGMSVSGTGRLCDWSIRNRPALQGFNGYSHFAVKAEQGGKLLDARVLNGAYDENPAGGPGMRPMFDGFGHGAMRQTMAGIPHFRDTEFYGRFPAADLVFRDARFPGAVRMTALSPFIPHNDRDSSMPVAMFSFELANTTDAPIDYTLAGTLGNYGNNSGVHSFRKDGAVSTLQLTSSDPDQPEADRGDLTIATDADDVQHQDYHFRGQWFDNLTVFWKDFARIGPLPQRRYEVPRATKQMNGIPEHATLAAKVTVPPGSSRTVRFVISWSFPQGDVYWAHRNKPDGAIPNQTTPLWTNYYA